MNTLVIYSETGEVIFTQTGKNIPAHVGTAVIELPDGKTISRVDTATGEVILADKPRTADEQLETLKKAAVITASAFTDEQAAAVPDLYPEWTAGEAVAAGDRRYYAAAGKLYKALQSHTAQPDWTPDLTPALWAEII